jgi:glutamate racemase
LRSALKERGVGSCDIVSRGGVGLARAVENDEPGMHECARTNFVAMVESYRAGGGRFPMRAVILGCTHYPFVLPVFKAAAAELRRDPKYAAVLAEDLVFVDPAVYTAMQCYRALRDDGILNRKCAGSPRVKSFMSVGRDGPLPAEVKYGRSPGEKDIGTVIVPMTRKTMSPDAVKRLCELLPASSREIFQ